MSLRAEGLWLINMIYKNDTASLLSELDRQAATAPNRTLRVQHKQDWVWIKKSVPAKRKIWHCLQCLLSSFFPILQVTVSPGGVEGLEIEAKRAQVFRDAGFWAPRVYAVTDKWILLECMGTTIYDYLQNHPRLSSGRIEEIAYNCGRELGRVHEAGLYHGRAKIKDMVLGEDGRIGFIDFEENCDRTKMSIDRLQARELWLFLTSLARFSDRCAPIYRSACEGYKSACTNERVLGALERFIKLLKPFRRLLYFWRHKIRKDVKYAYEATYALEKILPLRMFLFFFLAVE